MSLINSLRKFRRYFGGRSPGVLLLVLILAGLAWETTDGKSPSRFFVRTVEGFSLGRMPAPGETGIVGSMANIIAPSKHYRLMTVKKIPRIRSGDSRPHPYVGTCEQCHLYHGGPGPGAQFITPIGKALEFMSYIQKLGPPLVPNSVRPHPPGGRCIKCHDIVVKVPRNNKDNNMRWVM